MYTPRLSVLASEVLIDESGMGTLPILLPQRNLRLNSSSFVGRIDDFVIAPASEMPRLYASFHSSTFCIAKTKRHQAESRSLSKRQTARGVIREMVRNTGKRTDRYRPSLTRIATIVMSSSKSSPWRRSDHRDTSLSSRSANSSAEMSRWPETT